MQVFAVEFFISEPKLKRAVRVSRREESLSTPKLFVHQVSESIGLLTPRNGVRNGRVRALSSSVPDRNRVLGQLIGAIGNYSTSDEVDLCGVRPILDDSGRQGVSDALQLLKLKDGGGIYIQEPVLGAMSPT